MSLQASKRANVNAGCRRAARSSLLRCADASRMKPALTAIAADVELHRIVGRFAHAKQIGALRDGARVRISTRSAFPRLVSFIALRSVIDTHLPWNRCSQPLHTMQKRRDSKPRAHSGQTAASAPRRCDIRCAFCNWRDDNRLATSHVRAQTNIFSHAIDRLDTCSLTTCSSLVRRRPRSSVNRRLEIVVVGGRIGVKRDLVRILESRFQFDCRHSC